MTQFIEELNIPHCVGEAQQYPALVLEVVGGFLEELLQGVVSWVLNGFLEDGELFVFDVGRVEREIPIDDIEFLVGVSFECITQFHLNMSPELFVVHLSILNC